MYDLGYKEEMPEVEIKMDAPKKEPKVYYPSLYIRSKEKIEFPDGEFKFTATGKQIMYKEKEGEDFCYEIEVMDIEPKGAAKKKAEKKEMASMTGEDDEIGDSFDKALDKMDEKYPDNAEEVETS
jgi:hypothetical protein